MCRQVKWSMIISFRWVKRVLGNICYKRGLAESLRAYNWPHVTKPALTYGWWAQMTCVTSGLSLKWVRAWTFSSTSLPVMAFRRALCSDGEHNLWENCSWDLGNAQWTLSEWEIHLSQGHKVNFLRQHNLLPWRYKIWYWKEDVAVTKPKICVIDCTVK